MIGRMIGGGLLALTLSGQASRPALPLVFERNLGQSDPAVLFLSRGAGHQIFFTPGAAVLSGPGGSIRMQLEGANPDVVVAGGEALEGSANYLAGDPAKWRTGIPLYDKVVYRNLYPGIDLIFYGRDGRMEYDFVLAPRASPQSIRISFDGIESLRLEDGDLVLSAAGGELRHRRPVVYQERHGRKVAIQAEYVILGPREMGFQVGAYDRTRPLTIDPVLVYATYLGGSAADYAWGLAVDASGATYIAGETWGGDFPRTYVAGPAGSQQAFLVKLNPAGTSLVYATYFGGRSRDSARAVALDAVGNAYVAGFTYSTDFPTTAGAWRTASAGQEDAFVLKLGPTGTPVYSTLLGAAGSDFATGIAVDTAGNAYIGGYTSSLAFPATSGVVQRTYGGGVQDAFAAKLNASGSALLYATYLGGSGNDVANGIAVDGGGFASLTGYTDSSNFPVRNAFRATPGGSGDAFLARLTPAGDQLAYATYLGGRQPDRAAAAAVDASGNAYVAGSTISLDFPATAGAYQTAKRGDYDAFVAKFNLSGVLVYATYLGGEGSDETAAIAVDAQGKAYVAGHTTSFQFPVLEAVEAAPKGGRDAFAAAVAANGAELLWSTYLGGAAEDRATAVAVDAGGATYIGGWTASAGFSVTTGAYRGTSAGSMEAFVAKLHGQVNQPPTVAMVPASGSGAVATLSFQASDPNGAADVDAMYILIGFSVAAANTCYLGYDARTGQIWLASDRGDAWVAAPKPGEPGTVQNSQCAVDLGNSSVSLSTNTVTLTLKITFSSAFAGSRNIYLLAGDRSQLYSGWRQVGAWMAPGNQAPAVAVAPVSGSGAVATLSFQASDPNGAADVDAMYILIGSSVAAANACYLGYDARTGQIWLASDGGDAWVAAPKPGEPGTVQNSQCAVDLGNSAASLSTNTVTLTLKITFSLAFAGSRNIYLLAADRSQLYSGWRQVGAWTAPGNQAPAVAVAPVSGSGAVATLSFQASDPNGAVDVDAMYILIGSSVAAANACYLGYDARTGQIWLASDGGDGWIQAPKPGEPGTVQNSQCAVDLGNSSASVLGNAVTLTLKFTFSSAFAGSRNIYMLARDRGLLYSGWRQVGTWIR